MRNLRKNVEKSTRVAESRIPEFEIEILIFFSQIPHEYGRGKEEQERHHERGKKGKNQKEKKRKKEKKRASKLELVGHVSRLKFQV